MVERRHRKNQGGAFIAGGLGGSKALGFLKLREPSTTRAEMGVNGLLLPPYAPTADFRANE